MKLHVHARQLVFLRKSDCLGCAVLLCLVVCLTLLASFFSHLSCVFILRAPPRIRHRSSSLPPPLPPCPPPPTLPTLPPVGTHGAPHTQRMASLPISSSTHPHLHQYHRQERRGGRREDMLMIFHLSLSPDAPGHHFPSPPPPSCTPSHLPPLTAPPVTPATVPIQHTTKVSEKLHH